MPADRAALGERVHIVRDGVTLCGLTIAGNGARTDLVALREWPPCHECLEARTAEVAAKAGHAALPGLDLEDAGDHDRHWVYRVTVPAGTWPGLHDGAGEVLEALKRHLADQGRAGAKVSVEWSDASGRATRSGTVTS